jgi:type I restriction enzyme, S subunit
MSKEGFPESWTRMPLSDVTKRASSTDPATNPGQRIRYVDVSAVSSDQLEILSSAEFTGADAPSRARKLIHSGDVLFATVRPSLRRVAIVPEDLDGEVCSTAFCVIRANPEVVDPTYLFFAVSEDRFVRRVTVHQRGVGYPAVTDRTVLRESILVPSLGEQRKIANALNVVRNAQRATRRVIEAVAEAKRSLSADLIPIPVSGATSRYVQRVSEVAPLGELLREELRNGISALESANGRGIRTFTLTAVTENEFTERNTKFTDVEPARVESLWAEPGDIFVERANTRELVGTAALYEGPTKFAIFPDLFVRVRLRPEKVDPKFLVEFLALPWARSYFRRNAHLTAGDMPKIGHATIGRIPIPLLPILEQRRIASSLRTLDRKFETEHGRFVALQGLYATLLHDLLSGKTRVPMGEARIDA